MAQTIWGIGQVLGKRDDETALGAAERVSAMLSDIESLCSATDDESPYDAVGRLMTDYRDVVRQRDRLAHELGTIEWQTRLLLVRVCEIEERVSASRIGRAALSVAKACGVLAGAFKRRRG